MVHSFPCQREMLLLSIIQRSASKYKKGILHILECGHQLTYSTSASSPLMTNFRACGFTKVSPVPQGFFGLAWAIALDERSCRILENKAPDLRWIHLIRFWYFQNRILLMNPHYLRYILGCRSVRCSVSFAGLRFTLAESCLIQSTKTWYLIAFSNKVNPKSTNICSYCDLFLSTFPI